MLNIEKYLYLAQIGISPNKFKKTFLINVLVAFSLSMLLFIVSLLFKIHIIPISLSDETIFDVLLCFSPIPLIASFIFSINPLLKGYNELKQVEEELPFTSALLALYSVAGLPPSIAIERLKYFTETFPASSRMSKRIEKLRQLYALDEWAAIKKEAEIIGSEKIQDFIFSMIGTIRSGVDLYIMLKDKMKSYFTILKESYINLAEKMKAMADVILVLFGVLPMVLFTLYSMFASQESFLQIQLYSYFLIPLLTIIIIWIINSLYPKTPLSFIKFYKRIIYYIPISIITGLIPFFTLQLLSKITEYFSLYKITLSIFLASLSLFLIEGIHFHREMQRLNRIDNALPNFLRDMTEEIKRGVSPILSISSILKIKSYGKDFDELLGRIEKAIVSGASFEDAIKSVKNDLSWNGLIVFSLLSEAIKFGGKGEVFEEITNITREITDINKIIKQSLSPLKTFSLITIILLIIVTGILIRLIIIPLIQWGSTLLPLGSIGGYMGFNLQIISKEQLPSFIDLIFSGLMINAVSLGLLTGKISGNKIGSGFIYVIIYLIISLISMFIIMFGVTFQ